MKNIVALIAVISSACAVVDSEPNCRIVCDYTQPEVVIMRQDIDAGANCESCNNLLQFAATQFACGGSQQDDLPVEIEQAEMCVGVQ